MTAAVTLDAVPIQKMRPKTMATRIATPKPSMSVKPIRAQNLPLSRRHASPMVMPAPKTARPTTTVSRPLSRIDVNQVAAPPARLDRVEPSTMPVDTSSPVTDCASCPVTASGPTESTSASSWVAMTTIVVKPSVAFGLARMYAIAPLKMSDRLSGRSGMTPGLSAGCIGGAPYPYPCGGYPGGGP